LALAVPLSRFTPLVGGGSAFFVRRTCVMKILIALVVLVVLVLAVFIIMPGESRVDRRAWLTISMGALRDADTEIHKFGAFTNHPPTSSYVRVFSYTNRLTIDGTDYQSELAAECERLTNRGFLTITTNQIYVWIDTKGRLVPLIGARRPDGF